MERREQVWNKEGMNEGKSAMDIGSTEGVSMLIVLTDDVCWSKRMAKG